MESAPSDQRLAIRRSNTTPTLGQLAKAPLPSYALHMAGTACTHDGSHGVSDATVGAALSRAAARSVEQGLRWTEPRRRVYELLLRAGAPVKAYDLMDAYSDDRTPKPPTVYRALEFLEQSGLVHRIASLNAYVACGGEDPAHAAAFLICDCCGSAEEFEPGQVRTATAAANARGFTLRSIGLEVRGRCRRCS